MILDAQIWQQTIAAAKSAAAGSTAWQRAIERGVIEIEEAEFWSFADGVLTLISTTSGKRYVIGDGHSCSARGVICKHRAARRLLQRYVERLSAASPAPTKLAEALAA